MFKRLNGPLLSSFFASIEYGIFFRLLIHCVADFVGNNSAVLILRNVVTVEMLCRLNFWVKCYCYQILHKLCEISAVDLTFYCM